MLWNIIMAALQSTEKRSDGRSWKTCFGSQFVGSKHCKTVFESNIGWNELYFSNVSHIFLESVCIVTKQIRAGRAHLCPNSCFYKKVAQEHRMQDTELLCSKKLMKPKITDNLKPSKMDTKSMTQACPDNLKMARNS